MIPIPVQLSSTVCVYTVDAASRSACELSAQCTAVFDVLARSIHYGILGFTFNDFMHFCQSVTSSPLVPNLHRSIR